MALQDLTPQLRTRLNRMERAVGWFLFLATALLVFGFSFYVYKTAESRGWFIKKFNYHTSISSGVGLKVGDPVVLMGFPVGEITEVQPNAPDAYFNVTVNFRVKAQDVGYIWSDSTVKVNADLLGNRFLEVTKGVRGVPTILEDAHRNPVGMLRWKYVRTRKEELAKEYTDDTNLFKALNREARDNPTNYYTNLTKSSIYWLRSDETPTVTDRAQQLLSQVEAALPTILALASNLNAVAESARPAVSNLAVISAQLRDPHGSLGEWLIPTNLNRQLSATLSNADVTLARTDVTLTNTDTNLAAIAENLGRSLDNLADITSNLSAQVQANTNILSQISDIVVHSDQFVQGLKHHWLLRSAFKTPATNSPAGAAAPLISPRAKSQGP